MDIIVMLGDGEKSHKVELQAHPHWTVAELLSKLRLNLRPPISKILGWSEVSGSTVFLSTKKNNELIRLAEDSKLSDYGLINFCTLWLMCSHEQSQREDGADQ